MPVRGTVRKLGPFWLATLLLCSSMLLATGGLYPSLCVGLSSSRWVMTWGHVESTRRANLSLSTATILSDYLLTACFPALFLTMGHDKRNFSLLCLHGVTCVAWYTVFYGFQVKESFFLRQGDHRQARNLRDQTQNLLNSTRVSWPLVCPELGLSIFTWYISINTHAHWLINTVCCMLVYTCTTHAHTNTRTHTHK